VNGVDSTGADRDDRPMSWDSGDVVVDTASGKVRGERTAGVNIFRGIPYGAPTGGQHRFRPPRPAEPWSGVRDALAFGPTAPQLGAAESGGMVPEDPDARARMEGLIGFLGGLSGAPVPEGEDCLVLNVWSSATTPVAPRAVLFWIHGGAFTTGSGSWAMYEGTPLAQREDVVVVTVNHRLGVLGYLHLDDIAGPDYAGSGNAGMLDLVLALQWVRENIANFGGDPNRVLVFGGSGGASKTATLMAMPSAEGLFQRAALLSGPMTRVREAAAATHISEQLLERLGLSSVEKLHELPYQQLVEEGEHLAMPISAGLASAAGSEAFMPLQPVVDGTVIPGQPMDPVASPFGARVPVLVGSTKDDMKMMMIGMPWFGKLTDDGLREMAAASFGGLADRMLSAYRAAHPGATPTDLACQFVTDRVMWHGGIDWAERKVRAGGAPAYVYRFDWETNILGGILGATHGNDIPYALNNYASSPMAGDRPENADVARIVSETFVRFARDGDPNNELIPTWHPYSLDERATLVFDVAPRVEDDPRAEIRGLYDELATGD
jgi:para-nitrobenzyl esterase